MSDILVRNLKPETLQKLKKQAASSGRSLQNEVKTILDRAVEEPKLDPRAALKLADRIRAQFRGHKFSDSTDLIREDRDR